MSTEGRLFLESTLGGLLGFDDGASDVLDHLLTIESREDLLEYLSQLLGDPTPELLEFVDNVGRFERGEPLTIAYGGSQAEDSKPAALQPNITQPTKQKQQTSKKEVLDTRQKNQKQNNQKSRVPPPKKNPPPPTNNHNSDQQLSTKKQPPPAANPSNTQQHSTKTEDEDSRVVEKSRPPRGKAKVHCGCFGTKHKSLTNCLYCGRISCVEEGYNFCNFCGLMVEEIKDPVNGGDRAWVQKERLLRFDKEFARRTEIFDDQADYQGPSTWMTAEERQQAEENQERQIEALKRPNQTLNIAFSKN